MAENALTRGLYQAKIGPTPRNALLGGIADALRYVDEGANVPDPTNPAQKGRKVLSFLSNALGIGDLAAVADRASYGLPQTQGTGFARQMLPETRNALAGAFPAAIAKPQTAARMAMSVLTNGLDGGALNKAAIVWHGSPHKFDKFDAGKIGTGEGAQAYGHGLYLAESPDVAGSYAKMNPSSTVRVQRVWPNRDMPDGGYEALATRDSGPLVELGAFRTRAEADAAAEAFRREAENLYKVDLPDPMIARMLDWDKPLADQSAYVAGQLERAGMYDRLSRMSHGTLWHDISAIISDKRGSITKSLKRDQAAAADAMREAGIPGIRYLDGGSRGAGAGTSNFVVFPGEENALTILQRNGQPIR